MDNQQLHKLPQPENLVKLLGLSTLQKEILLGMQAEYVRAILNMQFNEPENDALFLRQHANLHGSMQAVESILRYDETTLQEFETNIRNSN